MQQMLLLLLRRRHTHGQWINMQECMHAHTQPRCTIEGAQPATLPANI